MPKTLLKECGRCGGTQRIPKPHWKEMFQRTPHYRNARRGGRMHLWCHCDLKPFVPEHRPTGPDTLEEAVDRLEIPEFLKEEIRADVKEMLKKQWAPGQ